MKNKENWLGNSNLATAILRVSSARQKDNTSHHVQRQEIESYCKAKGLKLVNVAEIVESAKDAESRKKYRDALEKALSGGIRHLVFYMFDRETRNLTDNEINENLVRKGKIVLHYSREGKILHKDSPDGDFLMRDFHAIQSKQYSRNLTAKVDDSMKRKAEDGWYPSNNPPLGYKTASTFNEEGRERRRGKIVVVDPEKTPQVIREFELRANGHSFEEIRKQIITEGYIRSERVAQYRANTIETRIKNPFYRGRFVWKGLEYKGKHELFIPSSLIEAVDVTLYKRSFRTKPITNENALAGGWLLCGVPECGCNIVFEKKPKKYRNGTSQEFRYYHCTNGRGVHESLKGLNAKDESVWAQFECALNSVFLTEDLASKVANELNDIHLKELGVSKRDIQQFRGAIESAKIEEVELYREYKEGVIQLDLYLRLAEQIRIKTQENEKKLERAQLASSNTGMETAKSILELCTSAKSLWKSRTPLERVELLKMLLSNPVLDGTTVRYEIKKPFRILSEMAENLEWRARKGSNL